MNKTILLELKKKKIIFFPHRENYFEKFGGDVVQIEKTKEFLERKYGLNITVSIDKESTLNDPDVEIVHIFGLNAIGIDDFIDQCKKKAKKIALSTIFWSLPNNHLVLCMARAKIYITNSFFRYFRDIIIFIVNNLIIKTMPSLRSKIFFCYGTREYQEPKRRTLDLADVLLPNSDEELEMICLDIKDDLDKNIQKTVVVPNAIDLNFINKETSSENQILKALENFVMIAARIEPTKNQINVVKGLMDSPQIPILLVGKITDDSYYKAIKKLAEKRGNVHFVDCVPHEEIYAFYKKAKVHVLVSYRESPGLSSLEALLSGCQIVVASEEFCPVKYYEFDKYGFLCNPYDPKSIKKAVMEAYNNPKELNIPMDYKHRFSYETAADKTFEAYCSLYQ